MAHYTVKIRVAGGYKSIKLLTEEAVKMLTKQIEDTGKYMGSPAKVLVILRPTSK